MTVLIAGAGIGGLAAALSLHKAGIAPRFFERSAAFSKQGSGVQISPNGLGALTCASSGEAIGIDRAGKVMGLEHRSVLLEAFCAMIHRPDPLCLVGLDLW